jgi:hypothetical protein
VSDAHRLNATVLLCALVLAGCAAPPAKEKKPAAADTPWSSTRPAEASRTPTASSGRLTINDPCPARLHDLCGPLLLYFATNNRLPKGVEELQRMPGFESVGPYTCPVSKQPYVYNPKGIISPNVTLRAVIYDAAPTHSGYRWTIVVEEPSGNAPLQAKVVAWPESRFPKSAEK